MKTSRDRVKEVLFYIHQDRLLKSKPCEVMLVNHPVYYVKCEKLRMKTAPQKMTLHTSLCVINRAGRGIKNFVR